MKITPQGFYPLYDFTSSSLTASRKRAAPLESSFTARTILRIASACSSSMTTPNPPIYTPRPLPARPISQAGMARRSLLVRFGIFVGWAFHDAARVLSQHGSRLWLRG